MLGNQASKSKRRRDTRGPRSSTEDEPRLITVNATWLINVDVNFSFAREGSGTREFELRRAISRFAATFPRRLEPAYKAAQK